MLLASPKQPMFLFGTNYISGSYDPTDCRMTRKFSTLVGLAFLALALTACQREDVRLKHLALGISKDSTFNALGITTPERPEIYLINGQMIEAVVLRREGADGPLDSLSLQEKTPVVLINDKLAGWGWNYWDSVRAANKIAKIDSAGGK
jgi:hypothetical protein